MKNYVTTVYAMIFAVVLFSSCNKNNDSVVGIWRLQSIDRKKINNANPEDVLIETLSVNDVNLDLLSLNKNGTASFSDSSIETNTVVYFECYDWSISEDNKILYLTNGRSNDGLSDLDNREIEILSLSRNELQTCTKEIESDYTFVYTNTYKRFHK